MKELCKRGHDLAEHAYTRRDGKGRFCLECVKVRKAERQAEKSKSNQIGGTP